MRGCLPRVAPLLPLLALLLGCRGAPDAGPADDGPAYVVAVPGMH